MKNIHEGRLEFDDMELLQLEFYLSEMDEKLFNEVERFVVMNQSIPQNQKRTNPDEFLLNLKKRH